MFHGIDSRFAAVEFSYPYGNFNDQEPPGWKQEYFLLSVFFQPEPLVAAHYFQVLLVWWS